MVQKLSRKEKQEIKNKFKETKDPNIAPVGHYFTKTGQLREIKNVFKGFKKNDWKEYNFKTAKEGKAFLKRAKEKGLLQRTSTKEEFKSLVSFVRGDGEYFNKVKNFISKSITKKKTKVVVEQTTSSKYTRQYFMKAPAYFSLDVFTFYENIKFKVYTYIKKFLNNGNFVIDKKQTAPFRYKLALKCMMSKQLDDGEPEVKYFNAKLKSVKNDLEFYSTYSESVYEIDDALQKFLAYSSGWKLENIVGSYLNIAEYHPFSGSSYIPIPRNSKLYGKVINIKNEDELCAGYSIICGKHYKEIKHHRERVNNYTKLIKKYNYVLDPNDFPFELCRVNKYEELFDCNLHIYAFKDHTDTIIPIFNSKKTEGTTIDLFLLKDDKKEHFCYIPDLSALLASDISKHKGKMYFCRKCLRHFNNQEKHKEHVCGDQKVTMPKKLEMKFQRFKNQVKLPVMIVADLESSMGKLTEDDILFNDRSKKTKYLNNHQPTGIGYNVVCDDKSFNHFNLITPESKDDNIVRRFVECIKKESEKLYYRLLKPCKEMEISQEEQEAFDSSTHCHICNKEFTDIDEDGKKKHPMAKVRDHDHYTGKYRGPAHNQCNLNHRVSRVIPVVFHNLKSYDGHMIIREFKNDGKIQVIPVNREKYISFSVCVMGEYFKDNVKKTYKKYEIRFIDSLAFLNTSLASLVDNLDKDKFYHTDYYMKKMYKYSNVDMVKRKGIYPYEYIDSFERLYEKQLPSKDKFYTCLSGHITDEDYYFAQDVYKEFRCKNLLNYHNLYLLSDILLLTDVLVEFRKISHQEDFLDPFHYYTLPSYSIDLLLKMTGETIYLLEEESSYEWFEMAKRGGVSMIRNRYSKANNKYIRDYDNNKENVYIGYYDMNNLYGWSMSNKLPIRPLDEIEPDYKINELGFDFNIDTDGDICYFVEVDLTLPEEYHDYQSQLPMFPDHMEIVDELLSDKQKEWKKKHEIKSGDTKKLVCSLTEKKHYKVHLKLLQLGLKHGWQVTKFHKAFTFEQKAFMKPFVDNRSEKRKCAKSDFEKDYHKLCVNAPYGKTGENKRNRINVKLEYENENRKIFSHYNLQDWTQLSEDGLFMMDYKKDSVKLDSPIYLAVAILDLAKYAMYSFWYDYLVPKYNDRVKLLMTDTDSFIIEVKTDDMYKDFEQDKELFDFSNYPFEHFLFDSTNKKVVGKMKDETGGVPIIEFVGLRSKMYSFRIEKDLKLIESGDKKDSDFEKQTAKGLPKNSITHQEYLRCLFEERQDNLDVYTIRSFQHQLKTIKVNKTSLSCYDDKFFYLDSMNSLPYGHFKI